MLRGSTKSPSSSDGVSKPKARKDSSTRAALAGLACTRRIEIDRRSRVAVKADGVAADKQVVNAVRVEQSQELF